MDDSVQGFAQMYDYRIVHIVGQLRVWGAVFCVATLAFMFFVLPAWRQWRSRKGTD